MAHQEAFQLPSWQFTFDMASQIDNIAFEDFSPSFANSTTEDNSDTSSIPYFSNNNGGQSQATSFPDVDDIWEDLDRFEPDTYDEMIMSFINESEDLPVSTITWSPSSPSTAASLVKVNLEETTRRADSSSVLFHLLKAYGEAVAAGQGELSDVIVKCVQEKISPVGETLERLGFYLCPDGEKQGDKDYIRQESGKNMDEASRVLYDFFPNGKLAHFSANSTILEFVPAESESIHLVDFDLEEGLQWPSFIEALASKHRELKLTALKWQNDQESIFEDTKRRLVHHARLVGLKMKVEEMEIDELVSEIKRGRKRGGTREFLAFNCMVGLPHMKRVRSRKLVEEFLRVAKESLAYNGSKGVIVTGEGDDLESHKPGSGFGSFFEGSLAHYEALLGSIESSFPSHLSEARMALETLFVASSISCRGWIEKWMELRDACDLQMGIGLEGCKVSKYRVEEAREMVRNLHGSYGVRIRGDQENVLILEWKGVPLVKVSSWRS